MTNEKAEKRSCLLSQMKETYKQMSFPFVEDIGKYSPIGKIGEGTFGEVYKAMCRKTGETVAIKRVLLSNDKEGLRIIALREIKILQILNHRNVVKLIEVCKRKDDDTGEKNQSKFCYLVFEFCHYTLSDLLSNRSIAFELAEIKNVMFQLLNGLFFIHRMHVLHRDMKSANVLITQDGTLKLADFGLAKTFHAEIGNLRNFHTPSVVTLWYRPPELLLGDTHYNTTVDVWGAGCIMAEMWTRCPILQGLNEEHQLILISRLCGSIEPSTWPKVTELEFYEKMPLPKGLERNFKSKMYPIIKDNLALDLLDKFFTLDPEKRIESDDALMHDFFYYPPKISDLNGVISRHIRSNAHAHRKNRNNTCAYQSPRSRSSFCERTCYDRVY